MIKHHSSYVAGHRGLVGSAICKALRSNGYTEILTRNHEDLDLCDESHLTRTGSLPPSVASRNRPCLILV